MRFYKHSHQFYCGIDLHTRTMYLCVLDQAGNIVLHRDVKTQPATLLRVIKPFREDLVIGCECMFSWYWLADLCAEENIPFALGHALYMGSIHGGKSKNDRVDSEKIAGMLRGGMFPMSYVYPNAMRSTRDLLRRRNHLVHHRAELLGHIQNTHSQYNLAAPTKKIRYASNREGLLEPFQDDSVQKMLAVDVALIDHYDQQILDLELYLERHAKVDDPQTFFLLKTVPGIGKILGLVLMYEIHDIRRFGRVGQFVSYARLVRCAHESAGKRCGSGGRKIGNAHLRWAFGEAVCLLMRECPQAKRWVDRKAAKYGKAKALSLLSAKLGRAVYWMLRRKEPFDVTEFFQNTMKPNGRSREPSA